MSNRYSISRLNTFRSCPYQYKLRYIDKVRISGESIEAFMGTLVHKALEILYSELLKGRILDKEEFLEIYSKHWSQKMNDDVFVVQENISKRQYLDKGAKMLAEYYDTNHPFNEGEILGLELEVNVPLGQAIDARFRGVIDKVVRHEDGRFEIHDYKAGRMPKHHEHGHEDQLALYQIGIEALYPEAVGNTELVWYYLKFPKIIRVKKSTEELADLMSDTISRIKEVEAATIFQRKRSYLCQWCEYKPIFCQSDEYKEGCLGDECLSDKCLNDDCLDDECKTDINTGGGSCSSQEHAPTSNLPKPGACSHQEGLNE